MSHWTYINGTIEVSTLGRTQEEIEYILKTVLRHLPKVTGSEKDMSSYLIKKDGYNSSSSCDEFGNKNYLRIQEYYIIVVDGSLRDREFKKTYKEFQKWICRLAKRVMVLSVLVQIYGYKGSTIITDEKMNYMNMYEYPSWSKHSNEPNWCEYLLWRKAIGSELPMLLEYKYYDNPENDKLVEKYLRS